MKYQSHASPDKDFTYWCENIVLQGDTLVDTIPFRRACRQVLSDAGEYILEPCGYWVGQKNGVVYQLAFAVKQTRLSGFVHLFI